MSITGPGSITATTLLAQNNMMNQLNTLSEQLGTGQAASTYSGLGSQAGLALQLTAQLAATNGYSSTAATVGTTLSIAQIGANADRHLQHCGATVAATTEFIVFARQYRPDNAGVGGGPTRSDSFVAQHPGGQQLYFFRQRGESAFGCFTSAILNGNGTQVGLKQVIADRLQADQGANVPPLGRLVIPPVAGSTVSISEDVAGSPFGFKLAAVNSSLTGAVVTPSGPPTSYSVNLAASNPNPGDSIAFSLNLPTAPAKPSRCKRPRQRRRAQTSSPSASRPRPLQPISRPR